MKFLFLFLILSSVAFASDKECVKECKAQNEICKDKVFHWAQEQYIDIEGLFEYSPNCEIDETFKKVKEQKKAMKKECKDQLKECLKSCD